MTHIDLHHFFQMVAQPASSSQSLVSWFVRFGTLKLFDTLGGSIYLRQTFV